MKWIINRCRVSDRKTLEASLKRFFMEVESIMDMSEKGTICCCVHLNRPNRNSRKCHASDYSIISEMINLSQQDYAEFRKFFDGEDSSPYSQSSACDLDRKEQLDMSGMRYRHYGHDDFVDRDSNSEFMFQHNQAVAFECFKRCPNIPVGLPEGQYKKTGSRKNENMARQSRSLEGSPQRNIREPTGQSKNVDPQTGANEFLKCSPRYRRRCESAPRLLNDDYLTDESDNEERVPHFIFTINRKNDDELPQQEDARSRHSPSNKRLSRSLDRDAPSRYSEKDTPNFEHHSSFDDGDYSDSQKRQSKIRRFLEWLSEKKIVFIHSVASQGNELYCTCLCMWYRVADEYRKVSAGIQKMNRENR